MGRAGLNLVGAALLLVAVACWVEQVAGQAGGCSSTSPCPDPNNCCSQFGFCGSTDDYCVTGCQAGPCRTTFSPPPPAAPPSPPSPPPPPRPSVSPTPSTGAGRIITRKLFESLYPNYNKTFYSYDAFIVAARRFPKFLNEGCREQRLRELAAFSAHVQQETAGLVYVEEINKSNDYCDPTATQYPCEPFQKYFGRGPLQLSWNFNYGPCGKAIGVDILKRPFLVSFDPVVAFKASLWFWNTPREGGIPSIHNVIIGKHKLTAADKAANRKNGFGYTINIINGGLECGKGTATPQAANRVKYFLEFCAKLGVSPGDNLDCTNQKSFA
ncbi:hypothetical protein M758_3G004000 [Ceratodon purpureus]|nr:hypothetical protein M758_3G004000 [Ceratodon purpureus]